MALEFLENRIDIKGLNVETPSPNLTVDLEREFNPEAWQKLTSSVQKIYNEAKQANAKVDIDKINCFNTAADLKLLFPDRELALYLTDVTDDDEIWRGVDADVSGVLRPEALKKITNEPALWKQQEQFLQGFRMAGDWPRFLSKLYNLKFIFPDKTSDFQDLTPQQWESLEKDLGRYTPEDQAHMYAIIKLIYPDHDFPIVPEVWSGWLQQMRQTLSRVELADSFQLGRMARLALDLKVLAAGEAAIVEKRIEVVEKQREFNESADPLPEQRNF